MQFRSKTTVKHNKLIMQ